MPTSRSERWTYAPLTIDALDGAIATARLRLKDRPEFIRRLEETGRERALVYKTLVLTGLRLNELRTLTVGQLSLGEERCYLTLDAADEKNREGSTLPIRSDLAEDLRLWLCERENALAGHSIALQLQEEQRGTERDNFPPANTLVFTVPKALVKILDRDLKLANIPKRDERGRTIDIHALRTTFGTLMSKGGVAPRTAQAAMRHSSIDLTMGVYTDPKLLDMHQAVNLLPELGLHRPRTAQEAQKQFARATGTDDSRPLITGPVNETRRTQLAPQLARHTGRECPSVSLIDPREGVGDNSSDQESSDDPPPNPNENGPLKVIFNEPSKSGRQDLNLRPLGPEPVVAPSESSNPQRVTSTPSAACTTACNGEEKTNRFAPAPDLSGDAVDDLAAKVRELTPEQRQKLAAMLTAEGGK